MTFSDRADLSDVRTKINRAIDRVVDARSFEIVGGTDETSKLELVRQHLIANPGSYADFRHIPNKEIQSTTPKWLAGVQDATVNLSGISLRNLGAGTYGYSDMDAALYLGSGAYWHDDQGTGQINPANAESGHLIQDADAGDTTVTLVTSGEAANYSAGDRVLIRWFERQGAGSFPPNPGYFEWATVASVVGGVIYLREPLQQNYRAQAPDYTSGSSYLVSNGKARILNLTRSGYTQTGIIRIIGGTGVNTGNATNPGYDGALCISGGNRFEFEGCEFSSFFVACAAQVIGRRSNFNGASSELDKVVGLVDFEDVNLAGVSQGTGVLDYRMRRGTLTGQSSFRPRRFDMDGVTIKSTSQGGALVVRGDQYPSELTRVVNCNFVADAGATSAVQAGNVSIFTPDAISATSITVNTGNSAYSQILQNIDYGQIITLDNGKPPEHFVVQSFLFDGSGNLTIHGLCEAASPSGGQRILWFSRRAEFHGNRVQTAPVGFEEIKAERGPWQVGTDQFFVERAFAMRRGQYRVVYVNAYTDTVKAVVLKPYSGSDSVANLSLGVQGAGSPSPFMDLNIKTAGTRTVSVSGNSGAETGDTLYAVPSGAWAEALILHMHGDGGTGAFTDDDDATMALVRVIYKGHKPPVVELEI